MNRTHCYERYRHKLLSPQRVRELSQLRPTRAILDTTSCWLVILSAWAVVAFHAAWWTVPLAFVVVGNRAYALMIIAHDGLHRRLFAGVKQNDTFNDFFIVGSFGAITRINNRNHLSHHRHLGTSQDPDRYKYSCLNKTSGSELLGYIIGAQVFSSIYNVIFRPSQSEERSRRDIRQLRYSPRDLGILIGWQALLWTLGSAFIGWWAVPLLWYLPFLTFALLADNFRTFAEHTVIGPDAESDEHRLITYISNPVERTFVSPMHMNFHAVHHLWPSIPYYNLATADSEIRRMPAASGLEWRGSYVAFAIRYWLNLPIKGCQPDGIGA